MSKSMLRLVSPVRMMFNSLIGITPVGLQFDVIRIFDRRINGDLRKELRILTQNFSKRRIPNGVPIHDHESKYVV